jgi:hypothetical protein
LSGSERCRSINPDSAADDLIEIKHHPNAAEATGCRR